MGVGGNTYERDLDELRSLRRAADAAELAFAVKAAAFASKYHQDPLDLSPATVLKHECRMSFTSASRAIVVGEQFERLPMSVEAMAEGEIGFSHLALMAYTARTLTESKTSSGFCELDLLRKAKRSSVVAMQRACALYRQQMDPEACLQQEREGVESRFLELRTEDDGGVWLRGWLENEAGVIVKSALEPLSQRQGEADERQLGRRQADALVEIASGGARPHVQISGTVEALAQVAGAPAAELELGMPISAEALRRQTCDCSLTRVLLSSDSLVIDVGRAKRTIAPAQRAALLKRDAGCRFPGCERPGRYCEGHHLRHWARGGGTVLDNLVLLCRRHHFLVHEGGWELQGDVGAGFVAIPPKPYWLSDLPAA